MRTEITLHDDEDQPVLKLIERPEDNLVCISFIENGFSVKVHLDELKHALRKISLK